MKLLTGNLKGQKLEVPSKLKKKTLSQTSRKKLFQMVGPIENPGEMSALVLYGGNGAVAWELFSQGVRDIESVEFDEGCIALQQEIARDLGAEGTHIERDEGMRYLYRQDKRYDLIIATPEHDVSVHVHLPKLIFDKGALAPGGRFFMVHATIVGFTGHPNYATHEDVGYDRVTCFRQIGDL